MYRFLLYFLFVCFSLPVFSQNTAPIAVNDTFYAPYEDSIKIVLIVVNSNSGSQPANLNFLDNDSDPDNNRFIIDTALYNGSGFLSVEINEITPTLQRTELNYFPPLGFWGLDSIQYVIKDDTIPTLYDTAWVYFKVKRQEYEYLDLNNIKARVDLYGLFQDRANNISAFEVPKGSGKNTIFAANLWIAGKNQDSVYMNAETFGTSYTNYQAYTEFKAPSGPIMDSAHYSNGYDYDWDRLWKINIQDIIYHQNNWSNTGYQAPEAIENWPAHGDVSKGQAWVLAPFYDNNNDGFYNPYDGDYPEIKGQQAIYFIYNDIRFQANTNKPMKSEVHCMAYTYNCASDSALNNTVFVDYAIHNRSNLTYDSTYVGMWTDFDIGNFSDDFVGCDVQRSTFYGYNGDGFDEDANGNYGYQNHPPAQGVTFLQGIYQDNDGMDNPLTTNVAQAYAQNGIVYPNLGLGFSDGTLDNEYWGMEHFITYSNSPQFTGDGTPYSPIDYYNYMKGFWKDGTQMVWGSGHVSGGGTDPAKYLYPGTSDPLFYGTYGVLQSPNNWSEFTWGSPAGDRRGLGSSGPYTWAPGGILKISVAYVFGRDYQDTVSGNIASVAVMQERVDSIHSYYRNGFTTTACGSALSVKEAKEDDNPLVVYPNPFNHLITLQYEIKGTQAQISIFNAFGKLIRSMSINQYQTTIDLSNEANGIYFIQLIDGNRVLTKKVIKQ